MIMIMVNDDDDDDDNVGNYITRLYAKDIIIW